MRPVHNLSIWKYVSEKSKSASIFAANAITPSTVRMTVIGLPVDLHGVHFFGNGFSEAVEKQIGRKPVPIELRRTIDSHAPVEGECRLVWNPSRDELQPAPR